MTALTKAEVAQAVEAIRSLSDVIEKLHKSTWPEDAGDIIRKSDLRDDYLPRASHTADAATKALAIVADLERRAEAIEGARRDMDAQTVRKTYTIREAA
jgi:hypothetical protein